MSDSATEQQEPRVIRWSVRRQWTYDDSTTWWVDSWDEVVGPFMYEETAARIAEMLNALESELKTLRAKAELLDKALVGFDSILYWLNGMDNIDAGHEGHYRYARENMRRIVLHYVDALAQPAGEGGQTNA
jgi:hypothetical protein